MSNLLYFSIPDERKEEIANKVIELNKNANTFSVQVVAAEKFKTSALGLTVYEEYEEILKDPVGHLKQTARYWDNEVRKSITGSASKLRSFCITHDTYHNDLEKMLYDTQNFNTNKEDIEAFLGEIIEESKGATKAINESEGKIKTFVDYLEEDKDNLNSKVNNKINKIYQKKSAELRSIKNSITDKQKLIDETEKQLSLAVYGTVGSAAAIVVTPIVKGLKKPFIKVATKIAPKLIAKITTKLGGNIAKKIAGGMAVVIVLVEIVGLASGLAFIIKFQNKLSELRSELLALRYKEIDLDPEVEYLESIKKEFLAMGETTNETHSIFSELKKSWESIITGCAETKGSLDNLKEKIDKGKLKFISGQIATINEQFRLLKDNLIANGIGLNLKIKEEDPIDADKIESTSKAPNIFIPNILMPADLYAAYHNIR